MKLLTLPLILFVATPTQALTWNEFLNMGSYNSPYNYQTSSRECKVFTNREQWMPDPNCPKGYVRRWVEVNYVPC
jgi:hypothetical protein